MDESYKQALAETSKVINFMNEDLVKKIPKDILSLIEVNKDKNYKVSILPDVPIYEQNIKKETKGILAVLYREYLCDENERKRLQKEEKEYFKSKYSVDKLFENRKKTKEIENNNEIVVLKKENIIEKLIKTIRKFFYKKRT